MTKKQKIWLWTSALLFFVPEIIWSPIINFFYGLSRDRPFRINYFSNSDNTAARIYIILLQAIRASFFTIYFIKDSENDKYRGLIIFVLIIISLLSLFSLYVVVATRGISVP